MRYLIGLILAIVLVACGAYIYAGSLPGPSIQIVKPEKFVGQSTPVEVTVSAPAAKFTAIRVVFEQNGKQTPLFSLDRPASGDVKQDGSDGIRITRSVGRDSVPDLKSGPARIVVTAERAVLHGLR